ncbi:Jerky -like protein-like [Trichinella nativa]|uniref:Jerky-like protein-like n=1 Tax=Trichinella nativa TaxID=6335 RepID=A0A0V1KN36_9BILA|nr:Jerky -like protein-like [Trichinella nativa]
MTFLCFANATGSDRLQLLLVGKSKRSRTMIGMQKLPVIYDYQTIFIPHVKENQKKAKRSGKVLLIIDNAPSHPSCEMLDR